MKSKLRIFLWKLLGIDYKQALKIHDYVFLKNDKFSKIGTKTYDNGALVWRWTDSKIEIGKFCSIANGVKFIVDEGYHKSSTITSFPLAVNLFKDKIDLTENINKEKFLKSIKQREGITIGNDVWIGMGAYIMPGVTIGNGVTIAANSVVTKNIPDYTIAGGVPAKVIKQKHNDIIIKKLNNIAWWNWSIEKIQKRIMDFYNPIEEFVEKYYK